jgi:hypothetical protein
MLLVEPVYSGREGWISEGDRRKGEDRESNFSRPGTLNVRRKLGSESIKTQFSKIYFSQTHFYRGHKLAYPINNYLYLSNTANLVLIKYLISLIITILC